LAIRGLNGMLTKFFAVKYFPKT